MSKSSHQKVSSSHFNGSLSMPSSSSRSSRQAQAKGTTSLLNGDGHINGDLTSLGVTTNGKMNGTMNGHNRSSLDLSAEWKSSFRQKGQTSVSTSYDEAMLSPTSPPFNVDELARHYFPVTLGASYVLQATIDDGPSPIRLTESARARGLARPDTQPWQTKSGRSKSSSSRHHQRPSSAQSSSSSASVSSIERMHLMTVEMPSVAAAPVLMSSPFQQQLSQLRLERLRLEESHLLEVKRQDELEKMREPLPKWYELRTPRFHYEAHKNNEHVSKQEQLNELQVYERDLERSIHSVLNGSPSVNGTL